MMRLTKVELRRLFSRRLTSLALLGTLLITALMLFGSFQDAKPLGAEEQAVQRAGLAQAQMDWEVNGKQQVQGCLEMQAQEQKTDPKANLGCDQMVAPSAENFGKPQAKFNELARSLLIGGSYLLAFIGFTIGAGFVAAEFSSGSMGNWLTFEPRRMRVFASKVGAAGLGLLPVTVAVLGLLTAGSWLVVTSVASTAGTTAQVWGDLGLMTARSIVLVLAAAMIGAAFGMLFRHTAAVIGIAMGYLVLVEGIFGQALQAVKPWLLAVNFDSWLNYGTTYFVQNCVTDPQGLYNCQPIEKTLSFAQSSAYLGVMVVLVVVLAALVFRRRDVS